MDNRNLQFQNSQNKLHKFHQILINFVNIRKHSLSERDFQ